MGKINHVESIVNALRDQYIGKTDIANTDISDITDLGRALQNFPKEQIYQTIYDKVGYTDFLDEVYEGKFLNMLKQSWEFGVVLERIRVRLMKAQRDPSQNPTKGNYPLTDYEPVDIVAKYFTENDDFQTIDWRPMDQLWGAFDSNDKWDRFITAIGVAKANSITGYVMDMSRACLNNFMAHTFHHDMPLADYDTNSTSRCVNVLKLYNDKATTVVPLTPETCWADPTFCKFAVKTILNYRDRLTDMSSAFNLDGETVFTKSSNLNLVMLSNVVNDIKVNMQSEVFNKDLVNLPDFQSVAFWQGQGDSTNSYDEGVVSEINVTIDDNGSKVPIEVTGIFGCMYDTNGLGVNCEKRKTTSFYHPDLDQIKFYDKYHARYFNDTSCNLVVFYTA